jgi:small subunit ribosomal protein S18
MVAGWGLMLGGGQNFALISENMTAFGRIKKGRVNGLRPVNQRKMAKAIRRAVGLGIHPSVHLHPEILLAPTKYVTHGVLPSTQMPAKGDKL